MSATDPLAAHRAIIDACLEHRVPFMWKGPGTLLVSGNGAAGVVADLWTSGFPVLGLEGFEVPSTEIHPRLDLIFDASLRPEVEDPSILLAEWGGDVWVDITLGEISRQTP